MYHSTRVQRSLFIFSTFTLLLLLISPSLQSNTPKTVVLPNEEEYSPKCQQNILKGYMDLLGDEPAIHVDQKTLHFCPHFSVDTPFCCSSELLQDMFLEHRSHLSDFLSTVSYLKEMLSNLAYHSESFIGKRLEIIIPNKCNRELSYSDIIAHVDGLKDVNQIVHSVTQLLQYQLRINSSFICNICSVEFADKIDAQNKQIFYDFSSVKDFFTMMKKHGAPAYQAINKLGNLVDDLVCMVEGEDVGPKFRLSPDALKKGSLKYSAFVDKCLEQNNLETIDKACLEEASAFTHMNNLTSFRESSNVIMTAFGLLKAILESLDDERKPFKSEDIRLFAINMQIAIQEYKQKQENKRLSNKAQKQVQKKPVSNQKIIIDSDPGENLKGTIYGEELAKMKVMETRGDLQNRNIVSPEDQLEEESSEHLVLELPNFVRLFQVQNVDELETEVELFDIIFMEDDGIEFANNVAKDSYWRLEAKSIGLFRQMLLCLGALFVIWVK